MSIPTTSVDASTTAAIPTQTPIPQPTLSDLQADIASVTTGAAGTSGTATEPHGIVDRLKRTMRLLHKYVLSIAEIERQLQQQTDAHVERESQLRSLSEQVGQLDLDLKTREQRLHAREEEMLRKVRDLEVREAAFDQRATELEQLTRQLTDVREDWSTRVNALDDCERELGRLEGTIDRLLHRDGVGSAVPAR